MIKPSALRSLVTIRPHGSVRAGCNSSKMPGDHPVGGPLTCAEHASAACESGHTPKCLLPGMPPLDWKPSPSPWGVGGDNRHARDEDHLHGHSLCPPAIHT
jgi:hypothetical protein